jgi:HSP20 family protein
VQERIRVARRAAIVSSRRFWRDRDWRRGRDREPIPDRQGTASRATSCVPHRRRDHARRSAHAQRRSLELHLQPPPVDIAVMRGRVDKQQKNNLSLGLGGVFRGLSDLLQIAVEIAEAAPDEPPTVEARRDGATGSSRGLHAVYGVSVRVGAQGAPVVARFGNVRQNERKEPIIDEQREPMIDVLDEDDHYLVVAELPGLAAVDIDWSVGADGVLVIQGESGDRKYYRKLRLSRRVEPQTAVSCYENGVLQLKLWKQSQP